MATRSNIGIDNGNGTITWVYCHWDGYPSNNGKLLVDHYTSKERVTLLLKHGDISSLGKKCDAPPEGHTFENPAKGHTVYYARDRGETDDGIRPKTEPIDDALRHMDEEYGYLFVGDRWIYRDHKDRWRELTDGAIESDGEKAGPVVFYPPTVPDFELPGEA